MLNDESNKNCKNLAIMFSKIQSEKYAVSIIKIANTLLPNVDPSRQVLVWEDGDLIFLSHGSVTLCIHYIFLQSQNLFRTIKLN